MRPGGEAPSLVGRDDHRSVLGRVARHVEGGHPGLVVTKGEAGIGKTWLLEWFRGDRTEAGWSSRMGRCTPLVGPSVAYGPWKAAHGCCVSRHLARRSQSAQAGKEPAARD